MKNQTENETLENNYVIKKRTLEGSYPDDKTNEYMNDKRRKKKVTENVMVFLFVFLVIYFIMMIRISKWL